MPPKRARKVPDNGLLCGLRSATPSSTNTASKPPAARDEGPIVDPTAFTVTPSPRPASLTLPFENRDRASHLISDEEFDRIIRQSELDNPLPGLPSGLTSGLTGLGIRRSLSTANRTSMFAPRPRPVSANFGSAFAQALARRTDEVVPRAGYSRDPTLTALPRPPTKNDMAVYPSYGNFRPPTPYPGYTNALRLHDASINYSQTPPPMECSTLDPTRARPSHQQGHKRKFSFSFAATNMVESVKKRLKRPDSPSPASLRISSPIISSATRIRPRPVSYHFPSHSAVYPNTDPNSVNVAPHDDVSTSEDDNGSVIHTNVRTDQATKTDKKESTKNALKRTWSLTKDTARETFDLVNPLPRLTKMKEPDFVDVRPSSRLSISDPIAASSSVVDTPTPSATGTSFFTIGDPSSFAAARPIQRSRPWETAPRAVLGGEIERLEGRTMDLMARNEGYRNEISYLRARIGQLETNEGVDESEGQGQGEDEDNDDDKRKTWMTCDSE